MTDMCSLLRRLAMHRDRESGDPIENSSKGLEKLLHILIHVKRHESLNSGFTHRIYKNLSCQFTSLELTKWGHQQVVQSYSHAQGWNTRL